MTIQEIMPIVSPDTFENSNDIRLLDKCLNSSPRYRIPDHIRQGMVNKLVKIMDTSEYQKHQLKAIQTLVKLDEVNLKILAIMKPKRSESVNVNITKLTDAELTEALKAVHKLLPPNMGEVINVE